MMSESLVLTCVVGSNPEGYSSVDLAALHNDPQPRVPRRVREGHGAADAGAVQLCLAVLQGRRAQPEEQRAARALRRLARRALSHGN